VFVAAIAGVWELLAIPVVLYVGLRVDRHFKRSDETAGALIGAQIPAAMTGILGAVAFAAVVRAAQSLAGAWWWLATGVTLTLAIAALLGILPFLLVRLGGLRPIPKPDLTKRIAAVAETAGVPVAGIFQWETGERSAHTASVTGAGRHRRVLVSDHVLRDWTDDEVEVVLAHELAHHAHRDFAQTLLFDALLLSASLAVADVAARWSTTDLTLVASLPFIALVAGAVWLAATPARHALSRWQERRADQFALAVTGHADAFRSALRRLGERHLSEERPSLITRVFTHRHPTVEERLAAASRLVVDAPATPQS
jgi:STE24 endopeptidase